MWKSGTATSRKNSSRNSARHEEDRAGWECSPPSAAEAGESRSLSKKTSTYSASTFPRMKNTRRSCSQRVCPKPNRRSYPITSPAPDTPRRSTPTPRRPNPPGHTKPGSWMSPQEKSYGSITVRGKEGSSRTRPSGLQTEKNAC